jgi:hypothetical protein
VLALRRSADRPGFLVVGYAGHGVKDLLLRWTKTTSQLHRVLIRDQADRDATWSDLSSSFTRRWDELDLLVPVDASS